MRSILGMFAAAAAGLVVSAAAGNAAQQWPASLAGYVGVGQANETSLTIKVYSQSALGICKAVSGVMFDWNSTKIDTIDGFYCPLSGRLSFSRIAPGQKAGFQTYTGNVSEKGQNVAIAGVLAENANTSALGEYPFGVQSQP